MGFSTPGEQVEGVAVGDRYTGNVEVGENPALNL
jgi:hypothetical protein